MTAEIPNPFNDYPGGGRVRLGPPDLRPNVPRTGSARTGYGLPLVALSDGRRAYCDADLSSTYEAWLNLSVEHVVPSSSSKTNDLPREWLADMVNCVLACRACNEFLNGYRAPAGADTWEDFLELRDRVYVEKRTAARVRHAAERASWQQLRATPFWGRTSEGARRSES